MLRKTVIALWFIACSLLFLYSFTQVDLGLTLSRASFFQVIEKSFQYIGWFNRPLSTYLFCALVVLLFSLYLWTLFLVVKKKIDLSVVKILIGVSSIILLFSYNAFSYDFFNYIFDARIITHYHQNPYEKKALDYPADPMLGFMHWTHRTFPYGPLWLVLTVPLSFIGAGYFFLTFYLFKVLMVGSYILCSWCIYKIAKKTKLVNPLLALSFFALNPFVLIESLVSAHIDIVMMAVCMLAVYMLILNKKINAFCLLIASILIKFATLLLAPLFLIYTFYKGKNKDYLFIVFSLLLMLFGVYLQAARTTFQPWYFLLAMPFASLLASKYYIVIPAVLFSFLILFQYVPYFYTGNYDPPIPLIMNEMLGWSIGVSVGAAVIFGVFKTIKK